MPKKKQPAKETWCSFRTTRKLLKDVENIAAIEGRSRSQMIVRLLQDGMTQWMDRPLPITVTEKS